MDNTTQLRQLTKAEVKITGKKGGNWVQVAEMCLVGGSLAMFSNDELLPPYRLMAIYNGPGSGWHGIGELPAEVDYVAALRYAIDYVIEDEKQCG